MTIKKLKYLISIPLIIAAISCETDVRNEFVPEFKQKLVISSFISPKNPVSYIAVSTNKRIYGELGQDEKLGNLTGFISDNTREVKLGLDKLGFKVQGSDISIEEGKTYRLRIVSDKGLTAEASCTVPVSRKLEIKADTFRQTLTQPSGYIWKRFMTKISITDFPGEENYFRIYCRQEVYAHSNKPIHYSTSYSGFKNEFYSDKGKDGQNLEITSIDIRDTQTLDSSYLRIYLLNTDKAYYDYHMSLRNYSGGDDPFTEVSPVYSNVKGGLGIFAAYTIDSLVLRLK